MKKSTILSILLCSIPVSETQALTISADTNHYLAPSYGEQVLNSILENWHKPQTAVSGRTAVTIRIGKDGRPFSCEIRQHSSSEEVDNSICQTVAQIKQFPLLETQDTGEVYISFIHDNAPFLQKATEQNKTPALIQPEITGKEEVEHIKNPIDNPIEEIQENSLSNIDFTPLAEEHHTPEKTANTVSTTANTTEEKVKNTPAPNNTTANTALPLAAKPQPQTLKISREEALMPPSANLADPAAVTQAYSQNILQQASSLIRIPSSVNGTFQIIARIDLLSDGTLKSAGINKSSNNAVIDKEILRVLKNEIKYPPLPNKTNQSLWLTFNIIK